MRIGFEEERRQRQIWWEEMERPRPLSECPEIMPRLVAQIKRRHATDEDGGRFGAVGRHIGRIDWDADASGEQRIGGTNRVRFDWTNRDDRCRFRTLDDQEYRVALVHDALAWLQLYLRAQGSIHPSAQLLIESVLKTDGPSGVVTEMMAVRAGPAEDVLFRPHLKHASAAHRNAVASAQDPRAHHAAADVIHHRWKELDPTCGGRRDG